VAALDRLEAADGMRALLRFAGWATLTFALAWTIAHPWQHVICALASRIMMPPGSSIDWIDVDIFFPFDLSVFVALVLASNWRTWPERGRVLAIGLVVLVVVELLTLCFVVRQMLGTAHASAAAAEQTQRFVIGVIRLTGLVAAGSAWLYLLGWERLPKFASMPRASRAERRRKP
jgi:hypothetical protein